MMSYRALAVLAGTAMLASCGGGGVQDITAPATGAAVKFFNFGLNAPTVNFYANDTKMSAVSSTSCVGSTNPDCLTKGIESTSGVAYGSVSAGGFYSSIAPGQYTLSGRITTATDNGVAISNTSTSLEDGKYYSYYLSGTYDPTTKKTDAFVVADPIPTQINPLRAYVRFVNAIANSGPMTLYAKSTSTGAEGPIGAAVAYKAAGAFVEVAPDVYDLNTRATGASTNLITRTAVSFNPGRVYTISARGDMTVASTTATNRPFLDNTANR